MHAAAVTCTTHIPLLRGMDRTSCTYVSAHSSKITASLGRHPPPPGENAVRTRIPRLTAGLAATAMALAGLLADGAAAHAAPAAATSTSQFHGVNWADPNDNFITGPNIPVGLS